MPGASVVSLKSRRWKPLFTARFGSSSRKAPSRWFAVSAKFKIPKSVLGWEERAPRIDHGVLLTVCNRNRDSGCSPCQEPRTSRNLSNGSERAVGVELCRLPGFRNGGIQVDQRLVAFGTIFSEGKYYLSRFSRASSSFAVKLAVVSNFDTRLRPVLDDLGVANL